MLLRPRLSRTLPFALLVITTIGLLAYFPLSKIRAASSRVTILPSAGKPLVNLKSTFSPKLTYAGDGAAVAALQGGTATPTALAAADFNADGAMDVVASYSTKTGGALAIFHANPDAFAPTDQTLYGKAIVQGKVPPTFLPKASAFALPESADLLATADFNGDGKKDVLVAARGSSNLYLLLGDGTGNLLAPQAVPVPGQVRAFDVTADGHVAVTLDSPSGSQLAILDPSAKNLSSQGLTSQGLVLRTTYPLPAQGNSVAWGLLGGGLDVAVGAASNVVMIYGALTSKPQTETVTLPYQVQGLALGNFIWKRDARTEIAVQADDGSIHILQHGTLNTTPLTAAEIPGRRAAIMAQRRLQKGIAPNPTALGPWTEAKQLPYSGPAPSGPVAASAFNSPHVASSSTHDLMVVDGQRGQLHILDTSGKTASPSADVSFSGTPVAALALPNKINSDRDIVVLTSSQATPLLVTSGSSLTLNVNSAGDTDSISACSNSSVTSIPMTLTLREAVCLANNIAMTTTINVPAGTYVLGDSTDAGTGQLLVDTSGSGYSLSIIGEGTAANTIIEQGDGFDRILLGDYYFGGGNPITIENVTLQNGKCTSGNSCDDGGGAVLVGGMPGDDFTVVNVVVYNNQAVEDADQLDWGGGLNNAGSNFTITNCTISNNTSNNQQSGAEANGTGGGVYYTDYPPDVEGTVTITNSSFTNNTSALQGGGLAVMLDTGYPMTVTGSTFTGNAVLTSGRDGGAIAVEQYDETATYVTVSNSRIVGNTEAAGADQPATGISVETETTANLENNWWGCNAGPGGSGCDTVYIETSGGYTPVLTLSIGAGSTSVAPNGSTTLTANLTNTGSCPGYSGCFVPNGTSASFSGGSLGSANPGSTTFSSGVATSTFTAGSGTGSTTASVSVDNQTVDVTINIGTPPMFTSIGSTTFTVGTNSSFPVSAIGPPSPTITQTGGSLPSGVGFTSGTGSGTLSGTPNAGTGGVYSGITFQAANGFTPNATQNFTLTVDQAPSINSSTSASFTLATFGSFTVTTAAGTYPAATFSESGSLPNGVTFSNSGVLSGTPTQAGSFPITITAQNGVSPNASQNFTLNVSQGSTSITVTSVNPSSEPYGQDAAVTITAVLTWTGSGPEPTPGDVSIGGNGPSGYSATICGAPSGDTLTCTASYTPTASDTVGTYTETATFSGDSNYTGSSSSQTNNFSITQASTTTSVMSSQNPSTVGQQVTFTATIDGEYGLVVRRNGAVISGGVSPIKRSTAQRSLPQKGQAHPMDLGGTVTWSSNTGCAASTISGDPGTAQCITTSLPQGSDTITATYSGDGNHSGSTATLNPNQQVNAAVTPTSISVTSVSPSSEAYGQDAAVTITAVLSWTGSGPEPTPGDVSIGGNGPSGYSATICGAPSGDTLTCTASYTPTASDTVGTYTETATFTGDSNYTGSSSSQSNNFSITQASTTTSVMSSQNPSTVGQQVTFTATIDGEYGLVVRRNGMVIGGGVSPTRRSTAQRSLPQKGQAHPMDLGGTVTWSSNTGCAASTVSGDPGTAQCITTSLPQGSDTITATYSGDGNHSGSTATLTPNQQVNAAVTPTSISVTSVSPSSEAYGQDAQVTITAVLSWTGSGPEPTPGDVSIGGNGPSGYSATICGAPSGDTLTCTATYTPTTADIVGTYTETATFTGDSNYTGSSSTQLNNFTITQATTTTSVMSSQNPSTVGQQVTFTATIDGEYGLVVRRNGAVISGGVSPIKRSTAQRSLPQKGQAHPMDLGGTVTWSSNTGCAASMVSGDPGTAQCVTTSLPQGSDTITATYSGDGNHSGSTATLNPNQQVNAQTPQVTLTPSSINFGTDYLHALKDRNVTVKNTGTSSVTINSVSVTLGSGTNRGDFTALNLCPRTLPAGRSCAINVAFFAGNIGNLSATVYVNDNASGSPQSVGLSATVINPIASFSPAEISYGTVKVGTSVTKNVVLKNVGTTVLTVASIAITGADQGDYSQTNSCPSSLNPGASCPISVSFDPTTTGTRTAGLTVTDNEFGGKQTVPLEGIGSENLE